MIAGRISHKTKKILYIIILLQSSGFRKNRDSSLLSNRTPRDVHLRFHLQPVTRSMNLNDVALAYGDESLAMIYLVQAPYKWRHARLAPIREHLKECVGGGSYTPLLQSGLFDNL